MPKKQHAQDDPYSDCNDVVLRGRVAATPVETELPSGDLLVTVRLVVRRSGSLTPRPGSPTVDTLQCSAWRPGVRRAVRSWSAGDIVEVAGALRRRFWRGAAGTQSRWEVELSSARRLRRAAVALPAPGSSGVEDA